MLNRVLRRSTTGRSVVGGVAGPEERHDRAVLSIEHDTQHHLMQLRAKVLGEAALAERGATAAFEI